MLDVLEVPSELRVVSAHRSPDHLYRYAETARRPGHPGDHRRRRRRGPPAGHARREDDAAGDRRADADEGTSTGSTRSCRSSRCPAASRSRPSRSATPRTRRCSPSRSWRSAIRDLAARLRALPGRPDADGPRRPIERDAASERLDGRRALGAGHAGSRSAADRCARAGPHPRDRADAAPAALHQPVGDRARRRRDRDHGAGDRDPDDEPAREAVRARRRPDLRRHHGRRGPALLAQRLGLDAGRPRPRRCSGSSGPAPRSSGSAS